jgi:hypothetical protein
MESKELMLDLGQFDHNELLSEWRWLVDDSYTPLVLTAMGDMFLTSPDGKVHFLDLMEGQFSVVSDSVRDFQEKLHDPEIVAKWFLSEVVRNQHGNGNDAGCKTVLWYENPGFSEWKVGAGQYRADRCLCLLQRDGPAPQSGKRPAARHQN